MIRAARRLVLRAAARLTEDAVCTMGRRDRVHRFARLFQFTHDLNIVRGDFGDRAKLAYPWWPTPIDP